MTTTVDLDSDLIKDELSKLQGLPTSVSSWLVEPCIDSTDSEAVWVWAYLTDKSIFEEKKHKRI